MRAPRLLSVALIAWTSAACAGSDFAEDVAGIARLSILQVALLAQEISEDELCGFESAGVKDAVVIEGEIGERGRAIYRVERCELGFDAVERIVDNCGQAPIRLSGRTRITGSITVEGIVSGRDDPITPLADDAVTIALDDVVLDGFRAKFEATDAELIMREGSLSAQVHPRLARGKDTSYCAVPTGDVEVRHLAYDGASLLARDDNEALVFVSSSDLRGQIGRGARSENSFAGEMTVGGQLVELPGDGISPAIDEDYDRAKFEAKFSCEENLRLPIDYDCACRDNICHPDAPVADGVARLLPQVFGNIVALIEDDTRCGFSSNNLPDPVYEGGTLGQIGTGTFEITTPCRMAFAAAHKRDTDCHDVSTFVQGTAIVSGKKIARGYMTGDLDGDAIVPTSMDAVVYELSIALEDFSVSTSSDTPTITIETGTLTGLMRPVLALSPEEGACSAPTSFASFETLDLTNARLRITDADGERHDLDVERTVVSAISGTVGDQTNVLDGTITTRGDLFRVPSDGSGLDPDFDLVHFTAGFSCEPDLVWPTTAADCTFAKRLGPDVARASALLLSTATSRLVTDQTCGIESATASVTATAEVGAEGMVTTRVTGCALEETSREAVGDDCYRTKTWASGAVEMTGRRQATGRIVREAGRTTVEPLVRDPFHDRFDATFSDYRVWSVERDTVTPLVDVQFTRGVGSIELVAIMGENEERPGVFDIPTPIARVPSLSLTGVDAMVSSEGRHFVVHIDEAQLVVESGVFEGRGNVLSGFVVLDGQRVDISADTPLDEEYEQQYMDGSYACTPDLLETIPPN